MASVLRIAHLPIQPTIIPTAENRLSLRDPSFGRVQANRPGSSVLRVQRARVSEVDGEAESPGFVFCRD